MLVGAGEEEDVVAEQAVPAGERVGDDRRVGVPDVGHVVDVVDRRRDVVASSARTQATGRPLAFPARYSGARACRPRRVTSRSTPSRPSRGAPRTLPAGVVLDHVEAQVGVAEPSRRRDRRVVEQPTQPSTLRAGIDVRAVELGGTTPGRGRLPPTDGRAPSPRSRRRWSRRRSRCAARRGATPTLARRSRGRRSRPTPRFQASGTRRQTSGTARRPSARGQRSVASRTSTSSPSGEGEAEPDAERGRPAPACRHGRGRRRVYRGA